MLRESAIRRFLLGLGLIALTVATVPTSVSAQTSANYSSVPPFLGTALTPNILVVMDNSGSMGYRAACDGTRNQDSSPNFNSCPGGGTFAENTTYTGLFDSLGCYSYDANNTRFTLSGSAKTLVSTACGDTVWDGNLLNWITFRRQDALKKALMGGQCVVTRAADGTCPASGSPALITLKTEDEFGSTCCAEVSTARIPTGGCGTGCGDNNANGRVPTAVQTLGAAAANLVFHGRGTGTVSGSFCAVNAADGLPTSSSSCTISGGGKSAFTEQRFVGRLVVATEPVGVIQQLGDKARFGLLEFRNSGDGGKVLVPIGSTQSTLYNYTTVATHSSNKAAMITAIERTTPATNTPLGETLYTGLRYIAQLPQPFTASNYLYPVAYSPGGPSFQASQTGGGLGTSEISGISASETCPAGYIARACGRDPFFFGSNPSPGWASSSRQVSCCKTFVLILTDGEPTTDTNIPTALRDYAHAAHGAHCSGNSSTVPPPAGTCFTSNTVAIPPAILLQQHKIDYADGSVNHSLDDVAYWGHVTDLRQATVPGINESGHDLAGMQNVTVYTFFAFGNINGREILMQAAKQGGFEDQNGNNLPDLQSEWDKVDNTTGLLAADGVPDTYFESSNSTTLGEKILSAFTSILQKANSGTSVSILASSTSGEGALYQAYFFPSTLNTVGTSTTTVTWTGYLQGLFVDQYGNLREDYSGLLCTGLPDGKLVLKHDCIVKVRLDSITNNVVVDRYKDENGDGAADTTSPFQTVTLKEMQPIWEGGRRLALTDPGDTCAADTGGVTCRRILTWVDINNDGLADATERIEFTANTAADVAKLCPFLGNVNTSDGLGSNPSAANCGAGGANQTASRAAATNTINFIRGQHVATMRDRQLNVLDDSAAATTKVWKLGDIISSTPVVVAAPRERYDVIYGDPTYSAFYQRYKDRRQVSYVGANDGMLHAFNAGFFISGDDTSTVGTTEQVRFTTTPKQPGTSTDCSALPCNGSGSAQYAYRTNSPKLGAELWGFIPQDLLPQLQWLTDPNYGHVFYVDLKPKVTDARIFADDADHPGGWGTILIGGFRTGGSCANCSTEGQAFTVTAPFNNSTGSSETRVFLSSYFVLDITNPEKDPVLLWTFRDMDLGFTTSVPAVLRVNPAADVKTSSTNEKWYVVFGTGPTGYRGVARSQSAKVFVVDLKLGPTYSAVNQITGTVNGHTCGTIPPSSLYPPCIAVSTSGQQQVRMFDTGQQYAFMGDVVTLDLDLDYRVDAVYAGTVACNGTVPYVDCVAPTTPTWKGALYRLTTNSGNTDPGTWGVAGAPAPLISTFAYTSLQATTCASVSPCPVGPITAAAAMTIDTNNELWIMFGTGRFYSTVDGSNADLQHFFGVKDSFLTQGSPDETADETTERNNLYNVSTVSICTDCVSSANVSLSGDGTYTSGFDTGSGSLVGDIQNVDGWFTTLPTASERNLSAATLLGGSVYFTSFVPSADICIGSGTGSLYGLYYLTGTPYTTSGLGTSAGGSSYTTANRSVSLGSGLPSGVALQMGAQGTGQGGTTTNSGCVGRATGFVQTSSGVLQQICTPASTGTPWSRFLAWRDM